MAPITRSRTSPSTPPHTTRTSESDTRKKSRFFEAYDRRHASESLRTISAEFNIHHTTGSKWLYERDLYGSPAYRRMRKRSIKLGRQSQVSAETCKMLVSPSRNPVRNQLYEAQIEYHHLPIKKRALQTQLKKHTNGGQRYKQAYVKKSLSTTNEGKRVDYGIKHQNKTIEEFWQYIVFTDEAHIDPSSMQQGYILRELGKRYDSTNIQRGEKKGVVLHVAGWINWHGKAEKLEFYKDEEDYIKKP